jgi:hypothetical protein
MPGGRRAVHVCSRWVRLILDAVWCGVVWCGVVWCGVVCYVRYTNLPCHVLSCYSLIYVPLAQIFSTD